MEINGENAVLTDIIMLFGRNRSALQDHDSQDVHLNYQRVDMSLMDDTDIQAAMHKSSGHEKISIQVKVCLHKNIIYEVISCQAEVCVLEQIIDEVI